MTKSSEPTRLEQGRERFAEVTGQSAETLEGDLGDLGRYAIEFAFGDIFNRPGLSLRDRELVTVAVLIGLGDCEPQLRLHCGAALNVGVTAEELEETVIQMLPYVGFPRTINALRVLHKVVSEHKN